MEGPVRPRPMDDGHAPFSPEVRTAGLVAAMHRLLGERGLEVPCSSSPPSVPHPQGQLGGPRAPGRAAWGRSALGLEPKCKHGVPWAEATASSGSGPGSPRAEPLRQTQPQHPAGPAAERRAGAVRGVGLLSRVRTAFINAASSPVASLRSPVFYRVVFIK